MKILIPLPSRDFDPSETAIPWQLLVGAGHEVIFATPDGEPAEADERMLTGRGLGPFSFLLRARKDARDAYAAMAASRELQAPRPYADLADIGADALLLPGGHAPRMKPYLESATLQRFVGEVFASGRPVAVICHGVVLAARSADPRTGRSILEGRRVTALPGSMELAAWAMTCLWLGSYYRTYPETVQAEVTRAVGNGEVLTGPPLIVRDSPARPQAGFVVRDGNLLTARWPGDVHRFVRELLAMLEERASTTPGSEQVGGAPVAP